jgi:hypothetical protein
MFNLMEKLIQIVLDQKNREVYDKLSMRFVKSGFFFPIINVIMQNQEIDPSDYRAVARVLELCACH